MNELRVIVAAALFGLGSYLVYDLAVNGFSWGTLLACLCGYAAAHYIWPRAAAGENHWYDIIELLVDLPYKAVALLLRSINKVD